MHHKKLEDYRRERLDEMTIAEMQEEMREDRITSEELVLESVIAIMKAKGVINK